MKKTLIKGHGNWIDGERFFNREKELEALRRRFFEGGHTLLTAQRRMGKTSLVRELKRQLQESKEGIPLFVDLEQSQNPADAIKEFSLASHEHKNLWTKVSKLFSNVLGKVDQLNIGELAVKLRSGIEAANWREKGDAFFSLLSQQPKPVLLAIDELPILLNRMLKGPDFKITDDQRRETDEFLSWLRKNAQTHRSKVRIILSGSIGLEPVLRQAGLSANANVFSPYELKPWSSDTATACLEALAKRYQVTLAKGVPQKICKLLGICVPHHVQVFFNHLQEDASYHDSKTITLADVSRLYKTEILGVKGLLELSHYEERLKMVLESQACTHAMDILTEAAVKGPLTKETVNLFSRFYSRELDGKNPLKHFQEILGILEHDGYLLKTSKGYKYESSLIKDWWRARHEQYFTPIRER